MFLLKIYYYIKPIIPKSLQFFVRRRMVLHKRLSHTHVWPIQEDAGEQPQRWPGWPHEKKFALVLTHDVDTPTGYSRCLDLMELEKSLGFRSSFNFVPEQYEVSPKLRYDLAQDGFEVGVHGLRHDGKLYATRRIFNKRATKINSYLKDWEAVGFRSPSMHHNLDWLHDLTIEYDSSTFDTDPFEPQPDGAETIFPFRIAENGTQRGYFELPYTLPQDFTLFVLMREKDNSIWERKLDWIAKKGGMALMLTHPDYMNFDGKKQRSSEYPVQYYENFLLYISKNYKGQYWHALPRQVARFMAKNYTHPIDV